MHRLNRLNRLEKGIIYTLGSLSSVVLIAATINLGIALNSNAEITTPATDCSQGTKIERFHCGLRNS